MPYNPFTNCIPRQLLDVYAPSREQTGYCGNALGAQKRASSKMNIKYRSSTLIKEQTHPESVFFAPLVLATVYLYAPGYYV